MSRINHKNKILVIESDRKICRLVSNVLLQDGYQVCCAKSVQEGVKAFTGDGFAIVIVNLSLKNSDPLKFLKRLKKIKPGCPVIILSDKPYFSAVQKAINQGAYDYLFVPFSAEELSFVVRNAVGVSGLGSIIQNLRHELSKEQLVLRS